MANKVYDGNVVIIPATADTAVRDVIAFGTTNVGVAQTAGLTGEDISVEIVGIYEFVANETQAFAIGETAKWNTTTNEIDNTAGTVTMGTIYSAKAGGVAGVVQVKIG